MAKAKDKSCDSLSIFNEILLVGMQPISMRAQLEQILAIVFTVP